MHRYPLLTCRRLLTGISALLLWLSAAVPAAADSHGHTGPSEPCVGATSETIYIPALSRVHTHENRRQPLASTVVVHNIDPSTTISISRVSYHDDDGEVVADLISTPEDVGPFASASFLTALDDDRGGIGANYIVEWESDQPSCSPIAIAIMIGGTGTHGISFALEGRVIEQGFSR